MEKEHREHNRLERKRQREAGIIHQPSDPNRVEAMDGVMEPAIPMKSRYYLREAQIAFITKNEKSGPETFVVNESKSLILRDASGQSVL